MSQMSGAYEVDPKWSSDRCSGEISFEARGLKAHFSGLEILSRSHARVMYLCQATDPLERCSYTAIE